MGFFLGSVYPFLFVLSFFFLFGFVSGFSFSFQSFGRGGGFDFSMESPRLLVVFLYLSFVSLLFCWNGWFLALGCVCEGAISNINLVMSKGWFRFCLFFLFQGVKWRNEKLTQVGG